MPRRADHEHTQEAIKERLAEGPRQSYLRDWVYGGIDGAVTTFALVSGVAGAHLAPDVILILGGASLFADGFAMAAGNYLATRAEHEELAFTEAVEQRHIDKFPEGEKQEVREILRGLGVTDEMLEPVLASVTSDRDRWVRMMLRDEYGLPALVRSAWRAATATFSAFLLCGLVPLVPFAAGVANAFPVSAGITALLFLGIGAAKSRWSIHPWWHSGGTTLAIGGGAAAVAFWIGAYLHSISR